MGSWVDLKADDGHRLEAYVATPEGEAIGAVVVVQEIFGVNSSIRAVVDGYAREGFVAIAPALFDRLEPNLELGYGPEDVKKAFGIYATLDPNVSLVDVAAAFHYVKRAGKRTAVVGFCYGGLVSWVAARAGCKPGCAAGLLCVLLPWWDWEVCGGGAGLPGDAASRAGRRPCGEGSDRCGASGSSRGGDI